jgi:hypothetical protein
VNDEVRGLITRARSANKFARISMDDGDHWRAISADTPELFAEAWDCLGVSAQGRVAMAMAGSQLRNR